MTDDKPMPLEVIRARWDAGLRPSTAHVDTIFAEIDRLRAELAAGEARGGWQPIETVPKDGTPVLVYVPSARREKYQRQVGWCGLNAHGDPLWVIGGLMGFDVGKPTHWQPLPAPPQGGSNGR